MCNVQLISINKEEKYYMYSFNISFLSFDIKKIGSETACLISQGSWFHSRVPECLIHFCRIFVLAEGISCLVIPGHEGIIPSTANNRSNCFRTNKSYLKSVKIKLV